MYLHRQYYAVINENRQNHIPLNARSCLYTIQKTTELSRGYSTMHSLLGYQQSQGRVRTYQNMNQNFNEFRTVLLLSANIGHVTCDISTFAEIMQ